LPQRAASAKRAPELGARNSLASRLTQAPKLSDPKAAKAKLAACLTGLPAASAKNLKSILAVRPVTRSLLEGLADASPYLWGLFTDDIPRALRLLDTDPDARLTELLAESRAAIAAATGDAEAMRFLRRMKTEAALLIALCDIGGVWTVMRATHALTELADAAVDAAVRFLLADAVRAGQFTASNASNITEGSGYFALAMGKMGAFELNYSSDIDLIVLYDDAAPAVRELEAPARFFVRLTKRLVKLLQERTGEGYVFRTDLRLRPDPSSTPIAISATSALNYYESVGQNWERAAMIKARVCAGDRAAGEAMLAALSPFIWRKYLDYASVAAVQSMKRQIHAFKGHDKIAVEGHNIKLGRGGIREIEFFAQTQQLIAGGRHAELRGRETLVTLAKLAEGQWIDAATRTDFESAYLFLRNIEHRLQMMNDEQTHTLPDNVEDMERFARFAGYENRGAFAEILLGHLGKVQRGYAKLFEATPADAPALSFPADTDDRKTLDRLSALGFKAPLEASATIRHWLAGSYRALKGEGARTELEALLPVLLEQLAKAESPDGSLILFDRFLTGLRGGVRLLSLLRQNPEFIALMALILAIAPRLADVVARHPQVMDALVDPSFFGAFPDEEKLAARLRRDLDQSTGQEDFLDRVRMFGLEHMFLIGARILSGTMPARQAGQAFGRLADVAIRFVHEQVADSIAQVHGHLRGEEVAVLAMGKLGGNEMTANSDLDLVLIYDFDGEKPESNGKRPLYGGQYFARLTQRLISALTVQTNYGALYEVDMRLRPSGRAGPLATQLEGFESYQKNEAWTWEHMALTRARVVSAPEKFRVRVAEAIRTVLRRERDPKQLAGDVVDMRGAIEREKGGGGRWDLKYAMGGLIDIEFIAQYLQLAYAARLPEILDTSTSRVLEKAERVGVLAKQDADILRPAVRLYHDLTQVLRLCLNAPFDPKAANAGLLRLLARAADLPDFATLEADIAETQKNVRASFVRILGSAPLT
jgi:glutamate-ammonia-ligase adenylyltransferase